MLGHYLAIQAWVKGLDCLVIKRSQLANFLGLERFKGRRIEWLREDLIPWFEYFYDLYSLGSFSGVYLSRKRFPRPLGSKSMNDKQRINALSEVSIVAAELESMPKEEEVVSLPALWAVGLKIPISEEELLLRGPDIYAVVNSKGDSLIRLRTGG